MRTQINMNSVTWPMRQNRLVWMTVALIALGCCGLQGTAQSSKPLGERTGWRLTFQDEFSQAYGAAVDETKWAFDTGGNGWGNEELQYYTNTRRNAIMDGSGRLMIRARAEPKDTPLTCAFGQSCQYSSARLVTKGIFAQTYGRFEARMRVPSGQGLWPAFWMLGTSIKETGWPACGEIDIMETIGREPTKAHGTIHGPGYSGSNALGTPVSLPLEARFADDFHVFALEWQENEIKWYLDDVLYATRTPKDLPEGTRWVFNQEMSLILNLAVGGLWPGRPDERTVFPADLLVDYVRVYAKQ